MRQGHIVSSEELVAYGKYGLRYTYPACSPRLSINQKPPAVWPAFEIVPKERDWSKFDRLLIRIFNDSESQTSLDVRLSDEKHKKQIRSSKVAVFSYVLPPYSDTTLVIPFVPEFAIKSIACEDIVKIHINSFNPQTELTLYLGGMVLLEPGEPVPPPSEEYLRRVGEKITKRLTPWREKIDFLYNQVSMAGLAPGAISFLENRRREYLTGSDAQSLQNAIRVNCFKNLAEIFHDFDLRRDQFTSSSASKDIYLGFAYSEEKVLPKDPLFRSLPENIQVNVARNEQESFQLIVLPVSRSLRKVRVRMEEFKNGKDILPAHVIKAIPVGYVKTKYPSANLYQSYYVGWWPDPLLSFMKDVEIERDDAQAFFISFTIPENQHSGKYQGMILVEADDQVVFQIPVNLRIYDFSLPRRPMMPLSITFSGQPPSIMSHADRTECLKKKNPYYPQNLWKRHFDRWVDMLASYGINIDCVYYEKEPEWASLVRLKSEGILNSFCIGYFPQMYGDERDRDIPARLKNYRRRYEKARKLGLLDYAYFYGCDEVKNLMNVERSAAVFKNEFPDIPLVTTAIDNSCGTSGKLRSVDAYCPLVSAYRLEYAEEARRKGKQVWWYVCNYPRPPYANFFVESNGLGGRLLMGAKAVKYKVDGFLYYMISQWNNVRPIISGPFTDWNPYSHYLMNGDGSWTYVGPDGIPLASIRLENFRDGLEDYAYVKILEKKLSKADPKSQWATNARAALKVPKELVADLKNYANDPSHLYVWRSRLAELIESAPAD